jgi:ankyrin repeat protein
MEGQTNAVQALLENNLTDLNSRDNNGDSLMHYAISCKGNALLYVIMLRERGIDVNMKNNEGDTPLILCALNGAKENIRIIQKLMEMNADPKLKNNKGETFYSILSDEAVKEKFQYNSVYNN